VDGCTLDAVAERSAMTRAGVAYHYPTKEDLLTAVARRFLDEFELEWGARAGAAAPGPGRLWRTYTTATLHHGEEAFSSAVLACALGAPDVRDLVKNSLQRYYARLLEEDQEEQLGGRGLLACLAADAVWLFGVLQVMPLDSDERDRALGEVQLAAHVDGGPR
jgi:AcrR family transcriptional regulator